ncbi:MAG: beta strand repeat-containing protein, partial [Pirellulaceae bacterium]
MTATSATFKDEATGATLDRAVLADNVTIANQVRDAVDVSGLGYVNWNAGNVYVTPNSFYAPWGTTVANVQRAVASAGVGDKVWVQAGAYASSSATATVNNLEVNVPAGVTGFTGLVLGTGVENGTLTGAGSVNLTGNAANNVLTGNDGDNVITGLDGDDTLTGGLGNDTLSGGAGTNQLNGGVGIDTAVFAGSASDYTIVYNATDITVTSNTGFTPASVNTLTSIENLKFEGDTGKTLIVGPGQTYSNIQSAVDAATAGDKIQVLAGDYPENVTINKSLTLQGAPGVKVTPAPSTTGILVTASDVTIKDLQVEGMVGISTTTGISIGSGVANTTLTNLVLSLHQRGLLIENSTAAVTNLNLTNVQADANGNGFEITASGKVNGLTVTNSQFNDNLYGFSTTADTGRPSVDQAGEVTNVIFTNTQFSNNKIKGIYVEKIDNVQFGTAGVGNGITASGNATDAASLGGLSSGVGIDINLKYGNYSNITVRGTVSNNGVASPNTGYGVIVKARNDNAGPAEARYNTYPASLTSVTLDDLTITTPTLSGAALGSVAALGIGNNVALASTSLSSVSLGGTGGSGLVLYGQTSGTLDLGDTSFASGLIAYIGNTSGGTTADATSATFGGIAAGSSLTTTDAFAISDKVYDNVDVSAYGKVVLKSGNVFITPNSFLSPLTTTANVQNAVSAANANDKVWVKTGAYAAGTATATVNNLTVDVPVGVTGFTGLVLDTGVLSGTLSGDGAANLTGNASNNTLIGNEGNNKITGLDGDDVLTGSGGSNTLDGGTGIDTATFSGSYADYSISFSGSDVVVTRLTGGTSVDTVTSVEKLQFSDKNVLLVNRAGSSYSTISAAVAVAAANDIVMVGAGNYTETLTINKVLTILGANSGKTGVDSSRVAETVIQGKVTLTAAATIDGVLFTKPSTSTSTNGINFSGWTGLNLDIGSGATVTNSIVEAFG